MPPVCVPPFRLNIKTNKCKKPCKRTEATNPRTKRCVTRKWLKEKYPSTYGENFDFDESESRYYGNQDSEEEYDPDFNPEDDDMGSPTTPDFHSEDEDMGVEEGVNPRPLPIPRRVRFEHQQPVESEGDFGSDSKEEYDPDFQSEDEDMGLPRPLPTTQTQETQTEPYALELPHVLELPPEEGELEIYREKFGNLNPMEFVRIRTVDDLETWGKIKNIMVKFLNGRDLKQLLNEEEDEAVVATVLRTLNIADINQFDLEKEAENVGDALDAIGSTLDKTDTYKKFKSFDSLYRHSDKFFKSVDEYVDKFWPSELPFESDFVIVLAKSIKESTGSSWEVAFRLAEKIKSPLLNRGIQQAMRASETNLEDFKRFAKQPKSDWKQFFSEKLTPFSISALHNLIKLRQPVDGDTEELSDFRSKIREQTDLLQEKLRSLYRLIGTTPGEPTVQVVDKKIVASHPMEDIDRVHTFLEEYFEGLPAPNAQLTTGDIPEGHDVYHYHRVHETLKKRMLLGSTNERILAHGCKGVQLRSEMLLNASQQDGKLVALGEFLRKNRETYLGELEKLVRKISLVSDIIVLFEKHQSEKREDNPAFSEMYEKAKSRVEVLHKLRALVGHQALKEAIVHNSLTKRGKSIGESFLLINYVSVNGITIDLKLHLQPLATFESFQQFTRAYCQVTSQDLSEIQFPQAVRVRPRAQTSSEADLNSELQEAFAKKRVPQPPTLPPPPPPPRKTPPRKTPAPAPALNPMEALMAALSARKRIE